MGKALLVVQGAKKSPRQGGAKSAGHFWSTMGSPDFRKGTLSGRIKIQANLRSFSKGTTQFHWTPAYEAISASFWQADFFVSWTASKPG
jgi:hypothetical protein